jgi:hypothetical protein
MADDQPKANRYRESKFYADGLTMQAPPAGTVPRERITLNAPLTTGREPDGRSSRTASRCRVREDRSAAGDAQAARTRAQALRHHLRHLPRAARRRRQHRRAPDGAAPAAVAAPLHEKPAGYIYEVATKGFGMMASYAAELTVEERWAVVAYIRALQLSQSTPAADCRPTSASGWSAARDRAAPAPAPAPHHEEKP